MVAAFNCSSQNLVTIKAKLDLYTIAAVRAGSFVSRICGGSALKRLWHVKFAMRELRHFCDAFMLVTVLLNKMMSKARGTSPDFEDKCHPF